MQRVKDDDFPKSFNLPILWWFRDFVKKRQIMVYFSKNLKMHSLDRLVFEFDRIHALIYLPQDLISRWGSNHHYFSSFGLRSVWLTDWSLTTFNPSTVSRPKILEGMLLKGDPSCSSLDILWVDYKLYRQMSMHCKLS